MYPKLKGVSIKNMNDHIYDHEKIKQFPKEIKQYPKDVQHYPRYTEKKPTDTKQYPPKKSSKQHEKHHPVNNQSNNLLDDESLKWQPRIPYWKWKVGVPLDEFATPPKSNFSQNHHKIDYRKKKKESFMLPEVTYFFEEDNKKYLQNDSHKTVPKISLKPVLHPKPKAIIELPRTKKDSIVYHLTVPVESKDKYRNEKGEDIRPYRSNKSPEQDADDNDNVYPHQYNIEIRHRFKGPVEFNKDKDKDNHHIKEGREKHIDKDHETSKYRNSEHKEEEHWHEKKWDKEDMKEEYLDGKPIKGVRVDVKPKFKAKESREEADARKNSNIPYYAQQLPPDSTKVQIEQHFKIPSPGFRVDKTFESWVKSKVSAGDDQDFFVPKATKGSHRNKVKRDKKEKKEKKKKKKKKEKKEKKMGRDKEKSITSRKDSKSKTMVIDVRGEDK